MTARVEAGAKTGSAAAPERATRAGRVRKIPPVVDALYQLIAALDAAQYAEFSGRLHAMTLELRESLAGEARLSR